MKLLQAAFGHVLDLVVISSSMLEASQEQKPSPHAL